MPTSLAHHETKTLVEDSAMGTVRDMVVIVAVTLIVAKVPAGTVTDSGPSTVTFLVTFVIERSEPEPVFVAVEVVVSVVPVAVCAGRTTDGGSYLLSVATVP